MARISVIIPTRNRASMLRRAVNSAKNAGRDVEIIIVNDASTDETDAVCRRMSDVVYLPMAQNVGLARARNAGIRKSTGEYITFLDDDDLRLPRSFEKQAKLLQSDRSLGFVYGRVLIGDSETCTPTGEVQPRDCPVGDIFNDLLRRNFIRVPSVMTRRGEFEKIGLFAEDLPGTEDWDAWLRLAAKFKDAAVQEPVAIYRDFSSTSGQMSSNRLKMCSSMARTQDRALHSRRAICIEPKELREIQLEFRRTLWDDLVNQGHLSLSERHIYYAMLNYLTAIRLCPTRALRLGAIRSFVGSVFSTLHY